MPLGAGESRVHFTFTLQNQKLEGSFADSTVELTLDTNNPARSSLKATVSAATVTTGNTQIDSTLLGSDWLDVKTYSTASFMSRELIRIDDEHYSVSGTLQIKDVARDVTFPMYLVSDKNKRMATGSFKIDRLNFELGRSSQPDEDTVGYQIVVGFELEVR